MPRPILFVAVLLLGLAGCGGPTGVAGTWKSRAGYTLTFTDQGHVTVNDGEAPTLLAELGDECTWQVVDGQLQLSGINGDGEEVSHSFEYALTDAGKMLHISTPRSGEGKGRSIPVSWSFFRE